MQTYPFGTAVVADVGRTVKLCWGHAAAVDNVFNVNVGDFVVHGPNVGEASCTRGDADASFVCAVQVTGAGLSGTNRILILDRSVNRFEAGVSNNPWGGACTCPNGEVYQVADNGDSCGSLQCSGGTAGTCNQHSGPWSGNRVVCGLGACTARHQNMIGTNIRIEPLWGTTDAEKDAACCQLCNAHSWSK